MRTLTLLSVLGAIRGESDIGYIQLKSGSSDITLYRHVEPGIDNVLNVFIPKSELNRSSLRIRTSLLKDNQVTVSHPIANRYWNLNPNQTQATRTLYIGNRVDMIDSNVTIVLKSYQSKDTALVELTLFLVKNILAPVVPQMEAIDQSSPYVWEFHPVVGIQSQVVVEVISPNLSICALISVQPLDRDFRDEERNSRFQSHWQTMLGYASLEIPLENAYEHGFFIVVLVTHSRTWCQRDGAPLLDQGGIKLVEIEVFNSGQDMGLSIYLTIMFFTSLFIMTLILAAIFRLPLEGRVIHLLEKVQKQEGYDRIVDEPNPESILSIAEAEEIDLSKKGLTLQDLGPKLAEANTPSQSYVRSTLYCWLVFLMGLFYSLPVIQLLLANQKNILLAGDLDTCYFNFKCKFSFMGIEDFSHILSNIAYAAFGLLFMALTWLRKVRYRTYYQITKSSQKGIPEHFGIFYALGGALIMEGVLSSTYHSCPSGINHQFDTTFMYVLAVLLFLKVHQFRHPDISANAHIVFSVIGMALAVEMLGFYTTNTYFWLVFDCVYLVFVFFFTINVYFYGRSDLLLTTLGKMTRNPCQWRPSRFGVLFLSIVILLFNVVFAVQMIKSPVAMVSWNIMAVLFGNMIIYIGYYLGMKLYLFYYKGRTNEQLNALSLIYASTGSIFLVLAGLFYRLGTINPNLSPAQSRDLNKPCLFMAFDHHDLWHIFSANGLFLLSLMILTLEDNNMVANWDEIQVF